MCLKTGGKMCRTKLYLLEPHGSKFGAVSQISFPLCEWKRLCEGEARCGWDCGGRSEVWGGGWSLPEPVITLRSEAARLQVGLLMVLRTPLRNKGLERLCVSVSLQPPWGGHWAVAPSLATLTSCGWRPALWGAGELGRREPGSACPVAWL